VPLSYAIASFVGIESVREVLQAAVTGVINGAGYALLGIGFALILGVTGRFHLAFGTTFTFTAYIAAVGVGSWGLALLPALIIGLTAGVVLGVACEALVYRPVAARGGDAPMLSVFVASLGLVIAGANFVPEAWGNDTRPLGGFPDHTYRIHDVVFTRLDVTLVVIAILIAGGLTVALNRSILGQQIKAVSANPEMASVIGVNVRRIFLLVFAIASLIGGIAAVFAGMRFAVRPSMGDTSVFYAFVVAFLAGVNRAPWLVGLVGLLIGLIESLSTLWVTQSQSSIVVFGLLLVWLTYRVLPTAIRQLSGGLARPSAGRMRRDVRDSV
jgi:branched-chain amino acid transport system permease protein